MIITRSCSSGVHFGIPLQSSLSAAREQRYATTMLAPQHDMEVNQVGLTPNRRCRTYGEVLWGSSMALCFADDLNPHVMFTDRCLTS